MKIHLKKDSPPFHHFLFLLEKISYLLFVKNGIVEIRNDTFTNI